jgi:hypothetical protein
MSAQPQEITRPQIAKNQVLIVGRVKEVRRTDNATYTSVVLPAPDEYSQPQIVEVASTGMIGRPMEDVQIKCAIGGYGKKFQRKDGTAGTQVTNQFRFIEA